MKKFFRILIWSIVAIIFIGTFLFLFLNSRQKPTIYEIITPKTGVIEQTSVLTGSIEPRDEIQIKPQISGIISKINVEPGDMVKEGDIISIIKVIPDASQLSDAESRVTTAQIALNDAQQKHERNSMLYERKVISREEFENTETTLKRAEADLASAQDVVNIVKQGVSRYNASEANTQVRATITGLVLDVPVKVGSSVIQSNTFNDGTTIATIADMNNLIFKGTADETEVGSLSVGMPVTITVGALPEFKSEAEIEYISPKGSESNGANTFEVRAAVKIDSDFNLRAGYSANAIVALNRTGNVLCVPESIVEFSADSTFVYILTDTVPSQIFKRTQITTGTSDGISIEVKSGINQESRLRGAEIKEM